MAKFRDGLIGPAVILCAIAFVVTFLLALTYNFTQPYILQMEEQQVNETKSQVLSEGDSFEDVNLEDVPDLNGSIQAVYKADNGSGYVFRVSVAGYGGPVAFMVGVGEDGAFRGVSILSHDETPGLGSKIDDEGYLQQFVGLEDASGVDSITGATVSSNALKMALRYAHEAWETLSGGAQ